jgi:beta-carotene/zeaxanthin 4-ketolase
MIAPRQGVKGALLAAGIFAAWLALHVFALFFFTPTGTSLLVTPLLVALICWFNVGLFIVAHDAMHGSLLPGSAAGNRVFGRVALFLYAGFSFDRLLPKHLAHHRAPGSEADPDFSAAHPTRFWPWYLQFMREYFGVRELAVLTAAVAVYVLLLRAPFANLLLFWALPAILSSVQLFFFGTYLPHRHGEPGFADRHNARSNELSWLLSLLSCYHFGYHHEHHLAPHVPWWRLPAERRRRASLR